MAKQMSSSNQKPSTASSRLHRLEDSRSDLSDVSYTDEELVAAERAWLKAFQEGR